MARESSRRYSSSINYIQLPGRPFRSGLSQLCITLLMSSLVISSKYVEVNSKGIGTVTLKNVQNNSQGPHHTILFKVKTNLKDSVNVRPGYGLIPASVSKDTAHIQVKFTGGQAELPKAKLMISWIAIQRIIDNSKIALEEFKELFEKQVRVSEGTTLMPFNDHSRNIREVTSLQQQQSHQQESEGSELLREKEESEKSEGAENKFQSLSSDLSKKSTLKAEVVPVGYSLKLLILVFLISFICGVFIGWQIPQPSLPLSAPEDSPQNIQKEGQMAENVPPTSIIEAVQEQTDL